MGLGRMIWRSTGIGAIIDTTKNIINEGSLTKGIKRTLKEDFCEDYPVTKMVYELGECDGKVKGYEKALDEYESKLLKQADEFLKQTCILENQKKC